MQFIASIVHIINWVAGVALILCLTILPIFSLSKKTRKFAGVTYYIFSYFLGLSTWVQGLIITFSFWGWTGIIIGLLFAGVGVIPLGLIASAIHGEWFIVGSIVLNIVSVFATKALGLWLIAKVAKQNEVDDKNTNEQNYNTNFQISLGKDIDNQDYFVDFKEHNINLTLLVGATGTGKSVLGYHIYQQLVKQNSPEEITFVLIDNVRVEFTQWNQQSPYLYCPTIVSSDEAFEVLESLANKLEEINTKDKQYFIHIEECDEFASDPERMKLILSKLLGTSVNNKVHIIFSTSRPAPEIISDWLLELTDLKIIFELASVDDYITVSGEDLSNSISNEVGEKIVILQNQITHLLPLSVDEAISAENFKLQ